MTDDPPHALDHYRDADYYDHAYARYKDDVAHYVSLGKASGGPVLELGGGTGRIAGPLAKAGVEVVLCDRMPTMLARAAVRLQKLSKVARNRIGLVEADFRELDLGRTFPLVIAPFNVFQHLYSREDVERALATVRRHLTPDGRFAFDVLMPEPDALTRDPERFYRHRSVKHPRDGVRYAYAEAFEYDHDKQIQTTTIRFSSKDDDTIERYDHLTQRQFFPRELEALLHYNGFEVLVHDGGFEGEPIDEVAISQVVIARARSTP